MDQVSVADPSSPDRCGGVWHPTSACWEVSHRPSPPSSLLQQLSRHLLGNFFQFQSAFLTPTLECFPKDSTPPNPHPHAHSLPVRLLLWFLCSLKWTGLLFKISLQSRSQVCFFLLFSFFLLRLLRPSKSLMWVGGGGGCRGWREGWVGPLNY